MLILNALMVAIIAASAIWVYLDATKHKIGKIPGGKGLFNMSAGAWAIVTLLLWIVGFPAYLLRRKSLAEQAHSSPVEVSGRGIKAAILFMAGGFWFLATAANALIGQDGGTGNSGGSDRSSLFDAAPSAISSSEWKLSESTSGIDGRTLIATRVYPFATQNTQFDVEIACQPGKKPTLGDMATGSLGGPLSMKIKSFVGDVAQPSDASALVSEANAVRQNDYSNPVVLQYPVARVKIGDNVYSGPLVNMVLRMGDYSNEAVYTGLLTLGESIPMAIELKNGAGTFELAVDRSSEVEQVLAACGQDEASVAKAELARQKAEQERAEQERRKELSETRDKIIAAIKESCRAFGSPAEFSRTNPSYYSNNNDVEQDIERLPAEMQAEISLDCGKLAPDELEAFQSQFEGEYSYYERLGGPCSEEQFLAFARSLHSGITTSQVRSCGISNESGIMAED